jgi:[ribosomal protein S18]-alanine N-acetyltransferase
MPKDAESEKVSPIVPIRGMISPDAPAVVSILQESPEASLWSENAILESILTGTAWIAEQDGRVAGFLIGRVVADEFEILNMGVAAAYRRRGIASRLVRDALERARMAGARNAHLEVRASNEPAISLYRRHGFQQCGRRDGYYQYSLEDALLFSVEIR